jgi:hypothetical protein
MNLGVYKPKGESCVIAEEYRAESKKSLPLDVYTSDVDTFLRDSAKLFWMLSKEAFKDRVTVTKLIQNGFEIHGPDLGIEWIDHLSQWQTSGLGDWSNFVSTIAINLLMSISY